MREPPVIARLLTLEEYLAFEEQTPLRHEYIAGEVFAMAGASTRHNLIIQNIVAKLRPAARRRGCRVFVESVKLRAASDRIYYPDLIVACGKAAEVEQIVEEPSLIVEVTSPSSRATDRREKLDAYQKLPSLRSYLIVGQRHRQVIAYSRGPDDAWLREDVAGDGTLALRTLDLAITLDEIYDDVPMPPLSVGEGEDDEWSDDEE
jgi:Uma2 family endonuclease